MNKVVSVLLLILLAVTFIHYRPVQAEQDGCLMRNIYALWRFRSPLFDEYLQKNMTEAERSKIKEQITRLNEEGYCAIKCEWSDMNMQEYDVTEGEFYWYKKMPEGCSPEELAGIHPDHPLLIIKPEVKEHCPYNGKDLSGEEALIQYLLCHSKYMKTYTPEGNTVERMRQACGAFFTYIKVALGDERFQSVVKDIPYATSFLKDTPPFNPGKLLIKDSNDIFKYVSYGHIFKYIMGDLSRDNYADIWKALRDGHTVVEHPKPESTKPLINGGILLLQAISQGNFDAIADDLPTRRVIFHTMADLSGICEGAFTGLDSTVLRKLNAELDFDDTMKFGHYSRSGVGDSLGLYDYIFSVMPSEKDPGKINSALLANMLTFFQKIVKGQNYNVFLHRFVNQYGCQSNEVRRLYVNIRRLIVQRKDEKPAKIPPHYSRTMMEECMKTIANEKFCNCAVSKLEPMLDPDLHRAFIGDFVGTMDQQDAQKTLLIQNIWPCKQ